MRSSVERAAVGVVTGEIPVPATSLHESPAASARRCFWQSSQACCRPIDSLSLPIGPAVRGLSGGVP